MRNAISVCVVCVTTMAPAQGLAPPPFVAQPIYRGDVPVYALASGEFDPSHAGIEVACLLADSSVVQLSRNAGGATARRIHTGLTPIQGMIDRPTISIANVHSGYAGNEIVIDGGKHMTALLRPPDGKWTYQILFDSTGYVGAGWGSRAGDIDPLHAGDEIFHMYEGILDFGTGRLFREIGGLWSNEVIYNAQVVMDSATGEFDPAHAGNEMVAVTEMGPAYEMYPPTGEPSGEWPKRTLWNDMTNAAWVVKIADVDPTKPGNELVYGTRYNNRITISYASGSVGHTLVVLYTGIAPPGYPTMYDVAVGDAWPANSGAEIVGVDASGSLYLVWRSGGAWHGGIAWYSLGETFTSVLAADFLPERPGDEILVASAGGLVWLLRSTTPGDLDGDGDVDGVDYGLFAGCFNGSGNAMAWCGSQDFDRDYDIDGVDFGLFSACFNGSGNPPACR